MTEPRFDDQLTAFLRWQSAQTDGAPSAAEMALRLPTGAARTRRTGWRLGLALGALVTGLAIVGLAMALVGALRSPEPITVENGPLVHYDGACGLMGIDPTTGSTEGIAGPVDGCRRGSRSEPADALIGLTYHDVTGSADGRFVVYGRMPFCGGCGSIPTPQALAAQGAYLFDRETGVTERLDTCLDERCRFWIAISPDGRYIAYAQSSYRPPDSPEAITIVDRQTGGRTVSVTRNVSWLRWAHDGRSLAFAQTDRCDPGVVAPCRPFDDEVVVLSTDGAVRHRVKTPGGVSALAWSVDDRKLLTTHDWSDGIGMMVDEIDLSTGETTTLSSIDADPATATWSPDGRYLAYRVSGARGESGRVHIVNMDGVEVTPRSLHDVTVGPPTWSPSSDRIALDGELGTGIDDTEPVDSYILSVADGELTKDSMARGLVAWLPGRQ